MTWLEHVSINVIANGLTVNETDPSISYIKDSCNKMKFSVATAAPLPPV